MGSNTDGGKKKKKLHFRVKSLIVLTLENTNIRTSIISPYRAPSLYLCYSVAAEVSTLQITRGKKMFLFCYLSELTLLSIAIKPLISKASVFFFLLVSCLMDKT